jgi:uncharacterized membrane protein
MKTQLSLLAFCLCGVGFVNAQTTTNTYSATTTNPTYTSPVTTDSTNSINSTTPSNSMSNTNSTANDGTMNSTNTTLNSTYSTNSMAVPSNSTQTTEITTTETYSTTDRPARTKSTKDYKNFVFGIYAGLNSTKFKGESANTSGDLSGRLGYQAGFFVRGGGRLFGQLGGEYFASSSNYFTKGDGQSVQSIQDQINIQYIQIPLYIGYKLLESDRGISAIRLQAGLEYANRISSSSGKFNLTNDEIKSGTFNALGQLGFDIGPLLIDLTYHHGLSDSIKNPVSGGTTSTGFAGSQRRIISASVGFKF